MEINDDTRGTCNTNSQIKFKTAMLKSSLCNYSDEDMLARGIVTITRAGADTAAILADERKK